MPTPVHKELACYFLCPIHTLRVPMGWACMGLQLLGGSSVPLLAGRQEREKKQFRRWGKMSWWKLGMEGGRDGGEAVASKHS